MFKCLQRTNCRLSRLQCRDCVHLKSNFSFAAVIFCWALYYSLDSVGGALSAQTLHNKQTGFQIYSLYIYVCMHFRQRTWFNGLKKCKQLRLRLLCYCSGDKSSKTSGSRFGRWRLLRRGFGYYAAGDSIESLPIHTDAKNLCCEICVRTLLHPPSHHWHYISKTLHICNMHHIMPLTITLALLIREYNRQSQPGCWANEGGRNLDICPSDGGWTGPEMTTRAYSKRVSSGCEARRRL